MNPTVELLTPRLRLHPLHPDAEEDQCFMLELLNQRSFIENIADRGVRTLEDAAAHIAQGPQASWRGHGHGLMRVSMRAGGEPVGICGLLRRPELAEPDLGYALLDRHAGRGYAREAAEAVLHWGWSRLGLRRVLAIVSPGNDASITLLQRLGFVAHGTLDTGGDPLQLFAREAPP